MKKLIKLLILTTLIVSLVSSFTACSTSDEDEEVIINEDGTVDTSKEVKLKMYLLGDKPKDTDLVYDEINKLLKESINASIEVNFLSWGDWQQKYPLLFASGENFDLVYTANWAQYNQQVSKGAFLEITKDMVDKYAPQTSKSMYEDSWKQAQVKGKAYMLPMNYKEVQGMVNMYRGDILKKGNIDIPKTLEEESNYYDACLEVDGLIPNNVGSDMYWFGVPISLKVDSSWLYFDIGVDNAQYWYDSTDTKTTKIVDFYKTDEYVESAIIAKEWADKGYWSKSALVNKDPTKDLFLNGRSGVTGGNLATLNGLYPSVVEAHPEWNVVVADTYYGRAIDMKPYIQNGIAINKTSKNPERALMALDLFRNDQKYFDLSFYGIEGKHYKISNNGKNIIPTDESVNYPPEGACPWGWREDKLVRVIDGGIPNYDELRNSWLEEAIIHPLQFFSFDDSKVKNEIAAINNIQKTYGRVIDFGFAKGDVKEAINDYRKKLKSAGRDKVTEELQRQIDEFLKDQ
ncbi:MAG: ABC transporter substrate-binding protein [Clostridiales bacterium]